MNITQWQQRVLHVLAQGGMIRHRRGPDGRIDELHCFTREGMVLDGFALADLQALRRKGLVASKDGQPYRITLAGRRAVRARPDNR